MAFQNKTPLKQFLGGFLLSYYQVHHPEQADVHLLPHGSLRLPGGNFLVDVDYAVLDSTGQRVLGVFDVQLQRTGLYERLLRLANLRATLPFKGLLVGLVIPPDLAADLSIRQQAATAGVSVIALPHDAA
jgi:hypothetical protein